MGSFIDMAGAVFGSWTVQEYVGASRWRCLCSCGTIKLVKGITLRNRTSTKCRHCCKNRITHGLRREPIYDSWANMMSRCYNEKNKRYARYGGRGIRVCAEWHDSVAFFRDMAPRPTGKTLERRDNDKSYSLDNCYWASVEDQANNRSNNRVIVYDGVSLTMAQWARRVELPYSTLKHRLNGGWAVGVALNLENNQL